MFSEWALGLWTGAGIAWRAIALSLVIAESRQKKWSKNATASDGELLSIFKPLPPLGADGLRIFARGLESFIGQLDKRSELLLGIHEADRESVAAFVARMREAFPRAELKTVYRSAPDEVANPKVAWLKMMAKHAKGELWMWSDADITAPVNLLVGARTELAGSGARMVTFPYVVKRVVTGPAFLDALFVNAEFYPGVLLLRRVGPVDFGLGAGMLFRRDDFLREVKWGEIGGALADDFVLGQKLGPVRISETTLETVAEVGSWGEALRHHLRWSKTVRWNRPVGSAAQVLVLPVLGWAVYVFFHLASAGGWLGLFGVVQADVVFAMGICGAVGCRFGWRDLLTMEGWSIWRVVVWVGCWLPWPVVWRGRRWRGPRAEELLK